MKLPKPTPGWGSRLFALLLIIGAVGLISPFAWGARGIAAALLFIAIRELIADSKPRYNFITMFDDDVFSPTQLDENDNPKILFTKGMQITPSRIEVLIEQGIETFSAKVDYGQARLRIPL